MNEFQEKKVVSYTELSHFLNSHKEQLQKNEYAAGAVNILLARISSLYQELLNSAKSSNEITTEILIARELTIYLCNKISESLKNYAKANNFDLLTRDLFVDFNVLQDSDLLENAKKIYEEANSVSDLESSEYLAAGDLHAFKNVIDNLKQIVTMPGMMFNFRANTSEAFDENIEQIDKLLSELDDLFGELKSFNGEFYSEYLSKRPSVEA